MKILYFQSLPLSCLCCLLMLSCYQSLIFLDGSKFNADRELLLYYYYYYYYMSVFTFNMEFRGPTPIQHPHEKIKKKSSIRT